MKDTTKDLLLMSAVGLGVFWAVRSAKASTPKVPGGAMPKAPALPKAPRSAPSGILRIGSRGAAVAAAQTQLLATGADLGKTGSAGNGVDGIFGPKTSAAVVRFQKEHGLTPDGVIGPKTADKLGVITGAASSLSTPAAPVTSPVPASPSNPTLRVGAKGKAVLVVQRLLAKLGFELGASGVDGHYGPKTRAAVQQFQRKYGLVVDGIVGPNTRSKMNQLAAQIA